MPIKAKLSQKRQKAVAVAKDVLAQLRKRKHAYIPQQGDYCNSFYIAAEISGDLQDHVDAIQAEGCKVCALGAAILSKARLYDKIPVEDVFDFDGGLCVRQGECYQILSSVFDLKTLVLMEVAFEKTSNVVSNELVTKYWKQIDKALNFGYIFEEDKARLQAIMRNVVANEGVFKP